MRNAFQAEDILMTGAWVQYTMTANNLYIFQARGNSDVINVRGTTAAYWTIKAATVLPLSSFNAEDTVLYFRGTAGVVLEILKQSRP